MGSVFVGGGACAATLTFGASVPASAQGPDPDAPEGCSRPSPFFCTNVDYYVPTNLTQRIDQTNAEMQISIVYLRFEGSRKCKRWYRDLQCQYVFARCKDGMAMVPCRSECERFVRSCPGANQACNSFPTRDCLAFDESAAAPVAAASSWMGALALAVAALAALRL